MVILPRIVHGATALTNTDRPDHGMSVADFLAGMLLTAIVPAAIWCGLLKLADVVFHFGLAWTTFALVGSLIATFLAGIYSCLVRHGT
jgi:hypothetical protein